MESWDSFIKKTLDLIGFKDYRVEVKPEEKRGLVFIYEDQELVKEQLPAIVDAMNHLAQMVARKNRQESIFIDINNYRHDRETIIAELARAAAKKAAATKEKISLPNMNSYERRIVHTELAIHPDVRTESVGEGKERYVVIIPIIEEK
ncbi:MAG: R3H domain-containing nucleic acid-binding protein [Candidatus Pacebacteria bacterium]|nr:R3H domain-containing nucleic acid-binding protein [Candidatus Paceibacterota bacterium]